MNCKDCTHYDVCIESGRVILELYGEDDAINFCSYFKDASKFIELPCSIGDTVYEIQDAIDWHLCENCEFYTEPWPGDPDCCEKTDSRRRAKACIKIESKEATLDDILNWMLYDKFNKTVFMTQEEAQKKLEELK